MKIKLTVDKRGLGKRGDVIEVESGLGAQYASAGIATVIEYDPVDPKARRATMKQTKETKTDG